MASLYLAYGLAPLCARSIHPPLNAFATPIYSLLQCIRAFNEFHCLVSLKTSGFSGFSGQVNFHFPANWQPFGLLSYALTPSPAEDGPFVPFSQCGKAVGGVAPRACRPSVHPTSRGTSWLSARLLGPIDTVLWLRVRQHSRQWAA